VIRVITLFLLFFVLACSMDNNQSTGNNEAPKLYDEYASKVIESPQVEPYEIKFQIDKVKEKEYNLLVGIELEEGNKFISPHARNKFKEIFKISLEKNHLVRWKN